MLASGFSLRYMVKNFIFTASSFICVFVSLWLKNCLAQFSPDGWADIIFLQSVGLVFPYGQSHDL